MKFRVRQRKDNRKNKQQFNAKRWNQNVMMLGPSMLKLLILYCSRFSLINEIFVSTCIYWIILSLVSRTNDLVYLSFSPNFLCRDKITNRIKIRDAKILGQNKCQSISSNEFIQIPFPSSLENNHFSMHYPLNIICVIRP